MRLLVVFLYFLNFHSCSHRWKVILAQSYPPRGHIYAISPLLMDGRICRLEVGSVVGHFVGHNIWLRNGRTKIGPIRALLWDFPNKQFWTDVILEGPNATFSMEEAHLCLQKQNPCPEASCSTRRSPPWPDFSLWNPSSPRPAPLLPHTALWFSLLFILWRITPGSFE